MTTGANSVTSRASLAPESGPPVSAVPFRAYVGAFERLGYDVVTLLQDIGVRRADLNDPDAMVPCAAFGRLIDRAMQVRPLRNAGIRVGAEVPIGAFPLLDYLAVTSDDVAQACRQISRYLQLVASPIPIDIDDSGDLIRICCVTTDPGMKFGVEYSISLLVHHLREETEQRVRFEYASLRHQPDDAVEMETILGCAVRGGAAWSGVALSRESWRQPMRRRDSVLRVVLEGHANDMLARLPAGDPVAVAVRRALVGRIGKAEDGIEAVARDLAMSPRTLQRRLALAGVSYQELSDQVHRDVAERHLADDRLSVTEVAYLLGYSEPAAFHRAFKRWNGVTPREFRQSLR